MKNVRFHYPEHWLKSVNHENKINCSSWAVIVAVIMVNRCGARRNHAISLVDSSKFTFNRNNNKNNESNSDSTTTTDMHAPKPNHFSSRSLRLADNRQPILLAMSLTSLKCNALAPQLALILSLSNACRHFDYVLPFVYALWTRRNNVNSHSSEFLIEFHVFFMFPYILFVRAFVCADLLYTDKKTSVHFNGVCRQRRCRCCLFIPAP